MRISLWSQTLNHPTVDYTVIYKPIWHRHVSIIDPIAQAPKVSKNFHFFPPKLCYVIFVVQEFLFQKTKCSDKNVCRAWRKSWFPWQPITKFDN